MLAKKQSCTGCGACYHICPVNCINMRADNEGFFYPQIDDGRCTQCGYCEQVCPVLKPSATREVPCVVYAGWSKNEKIRRQSSSGGIFSEVALQILSQGGAVCGAVYGKDHLVEHAMVTDAASLHMLRQSKYVQARHNNVFKEVKSMSIKGRPVLFSSTPCQCAGLASYLGENKGSVLLCDFVCHGVNSPAAYQRYLHSLEARYASEVKSVVMRDKRNGWDKFGISIEFKNGNVYFGDVNTDPFLRGFIKLNLFLRPCCSDCRFRWGRAVDITLGDFWGIKHVDQQNYAAGVSLIIPRTDRGKTLINFLQGDRIYLEQRSYLEALHGNPCMERSVPFHPYRQQFFDRLDREDFCEAVRAMPALSKT